MVAVFPGQGSQHVGMGKDLFDTFKVAKEVFEEASDAVHLNLKKLCFDGPESELTLTENTQPCLLAVSMAAFRVAQEEVGFRPTIVAGHSLGEYSALVAAGSLNLATATRWVQKRGAFMQKAVPTGQGTMAAILGIEDSRVEKLCQKATENAAQKRTQGAHEELIVKAIAEPANFNSPGQVVIAGSMDGIEEAITLVKSDPEFAGGKAVPLQVSAPFHCKLMEPARQEMAQIFAQTQEKPRNLECPYIPNRTARITRDAGVVLDLLIEQIDHPVLWKQTMIVLLDANYTAGIEFGPGKVLQGLAKRIKNQTGSTFALASVGDTSSLQVLETTLRRSPS